MQEEFRYVGKARPIHDAMGKVTGVTQYAADLRFGKTLYLTLLLSDKPHAIVNKIDCTDARKIPGVVAIFHCFNTTQKKFNRYKRIATINTPEQEQIYTSHPRFIGDRIGAVIAEDPEIAREACKLIHVDYQELPFAEDIKATLSGAIDGMFEEGVIYPCNEIHIGDIPDNSLADVNVKIHTVIDRINHVAIEPHACAASFDRSSGELTVWSPNQSVYGNRYALADFFGMPQNKIRVIKTTMGGSFGSKQESIFERVIADAALRLSSPVVLATDRSTSMLSSICRAPMLADSCLVFDKERKIVSLEIDSSFDAGAYLGNSLAYAATMGEMAVRNYAIPCFRYHSRAICTNMPVSGGFRGWGTPEITLIMETCLDKAAKEFGIDPIDLRILNTIQAGDLDPIIHVPFGDTKLEKCLTEGRNHFNWDQRRRDAQKNSDARYKIGVGMACCGHLNGNYPGSIDYTLADMTLNEDGSINLNVSLHDHGCGTVRMVQIIAGEVLGIDPELISVREGDTAITPFDAGCFTSRTTYVIGAAVKKCAEKLCDEICSSAAQILGIDQNRLRCFNGSVTAADDEQLQLSLQQLAETMQYQYQHTIVAHIRHVSDSNPAVHGAHFTQLKVDTLTGKVTIEKYLAVHDIGQAINPALCIGQIRGAVQMGASAALSESMRAKRSGSGKAVNSLKNYHVLNAGTVPDVEVLLIEEGENHGPYGAKSIGEVSFGAVSATIVSAINHALGTEWSQIPLTPDCILARLKKG